MNSSSADLDNQHPAGWDDVPYIRESDNIVEHRHPVAQSDIQASLDMIHAYFRGMDGASNGNPSPNVMDRVSRDGEHGDDNDNGNNGQQQQQQRTKLLASLHSSLVYAISRTVEPIPDDEFERRVFGFDPRDGSTFDNDFDVDGLIAGIVSDCDENDGTDREDEPVEYEDEDLIDMTTLERARAEREKVRETSHQVAALRDSVLERARNLYSDDAKFQSFVQGISDQDRRVNVPELDDIDDTTAAEAVSEAMGSLRAALDEDPLSAVQKAAESLGNTMEVVTVETSEDRILSQTELVIRSRTNDGSSQPRNTDSVVEDDIKRSPEDALIDYLYK